MPDKTKPDRGVSQPETGRRTGTPMGVPRTTADTRAMLDRISKRLRSGEITVAEAEKQLKEVKALQRAAMKKLQGK